MLFVEFVLFVARSHYSSSGAYSTALAFVRLAYPICPALVVHYTIDSSAASLFCLLLTLLIILYLRHS